MNPQFITIEGLEGAGKSSAVATIQKFLQAMHITNFITTREPGGSVMGDKIRRILTAENKNEYFSPYTELFLFYADRVQHIENIIKPALVNKQWVISDRFELSSYAYQGGGRKVPYDFIDQISKQVMQGIEPNLTFYLDVTPEVGLQRARSRGDLDRIEQEDLEFFAAIRESYLHFAKQNSRIKVIDAMQDIANVNAQITAHMKENILCDA